MDRVEAGSLAPGNVIREDFFNGRAVVTEVIERKRCFHVRAKVLGGTCTDECEQDPATCPHYGEGGVWAADLPTIDGQPWMVELLAPKHTPRPLDA